MLTSVFDELTSNQDGIGQSLKDGLRTDKIVGTCEKCKSDLIIRRGHRGSRFIGCSGYPECRFTLPLPRFGTLIVTDKLCEKHGMFHVRIINKGKRPWDLGCPHCNFLEWQAKKAQEKTDPAKSGEEERPKAKKVAKKAAGAAKALTAVTSNRATKIAKMVFIFTASLSVRVSSRALPARERLLRSPTSGSR